MSVNKVILVGNVGKDPETRYLDESTAMTKFPLATSETYKNKSGERVSTTEWHNIVLWRGLAQVAEKYVKKGSQIYIEGRIKTRSYDDSEGNKKYITEIVGDQLQLLGKRPDDSYDGGMQASGGKPQQAAPAQPASPGEAQTPSTGETQTPSTGETQTPSTGEAQTPSTGEARTPSTGEGDPLNSGDNGPDDLPF